MQWGLGIGDWAQSPIPNPQSQPSIHKKLNFCIIFYFLLKYLKNINFY